MNFEDLLYDSSRRTVESAAEIISADPNIFEEAVNLALSNKSTISARAARAVYFSANRHPEMIKPYLYPIISALANLENDSIKQNLLKILTEHELPDDEKCLTMLINSCFEWIDSVDSKPAIKVYSLEILYKISLQIPELQNELIFTIENQIDQSSAAFKVRGGRILKKLVIFSIFHLSFFAEGIPSGHFSFIIYLRSLFTL